MKKRKSVEEEHPKTVCALGVLAAIVGSILFFFNPDAGVAQTISSRGVTFVHAAGLFLLFVGFYFALVISPDPKKK